MAGVQSAGVRERAGARPGFDQQPATSRDQVRFAQRALWLEAVVGCAGRVGSGLGWGRDDLSKPLLPHRLQYKPPYVASSRELIREFMLVQRIKAVLTSP